MTYTQKAEQSASLTMESTLSHSPAYAVLRLLLLAVCIVGLLLSSYVGIVAYHSEDPVQAAEDAFYATGEHSRNHLDKVQERLQTHSSLLPDYAALRLSLARLYLVRSADAAEADSARPDFLRAAQLQLHSARQLQPSHYEAIGLTAWLEAQQGRTLNERLPLLRMALHNGDLEKSNQWLLGPLIVRDWKELPADVKALSGPLIKSMLSEQKSRQRLLDAMYDSRLFLPFTRFSPNRETSYTLRTLHAIYVSPRLP